MRSCSHAGSNHLCERHGSPDRKVGEVHGREDAVAAAFGDIARGVALVDGGQSVDALRFEAPVVDSHPGRSSTLMRFPMRSDGYVHGYPHGYVHGHPHGDAHQIEGKQARRIVYTIRARSLPRPAALEQQPECRRPMEEEEE